MAGAREVPMKTELAHAGCLPPAGLGGSGGSGGGGGGSPGGIVEVP